MAWLRRGVGGLALLAACQGGVTDEPDTDGPPPEPGPFLAGVAKASLGAPLGIGTIGNAPGGPSNDTPFSQIYAGTTTSFGENEAEVVALSRGEGFEVIFVRLDTIGMFSQLRNAIVDEVALRTGRAGLDDAIVLAATHTHAGPGRILNTGTTATTPLDIVADTFWAPFYERFVDRVATAIVAAIDDLRPAELGTAVGYRGDAHADRRCEDGIYENGTLPMLAVRRAPEGGGEPTVDALLVGYAIHGVAYGRDSLTLSQDVTGAMETAIEDRLPGPAQVSVFNSWAADMSIGSPEVTLTAASPVNGDHFRVARAAEALAIEVEAQLDALTWTDAPDIRVSTRRLPIDREAIGYEDGVFPFPYGGVYCQGEQECDGDLERIETLDDRCVPFSETVPAPSQTAVTVGRVGPYALTTFPGEPGTRLAEHIIERLQEAHDDVEDVLFFGYSQDYLGYSLLEDDWWLGGYEASGALWGPRQGQYLSDAIVQKYADWAAGRADDGPPRLEPFPYTPESYVPAGATDVGAVAADVPVEVQAGALVTFGVYGSDPWLGTPWLEVLDADGAVVRRPGGQPLGPEGMVVQWSLDVSPPWGTSAATRTFTWTATLSTASLSPAGYALEPGDYTLRAHVPAESGEVVASSEAFTVAAAP